MHMCNGLELRSLSIQTCVIVSTKLTLMAELLFLLALTGNGVKKLEDWTSTEAITMQTSSIGIVRECGEDAPAPTQSSLL